MAQFKLYIKHNRDLIPLTFFDSSKGNVLASSTYDESIKEQVNNYFELTFKMSYYINTTTFDKTAAEPKTKAIKIKNPLFESVLHGTQIRLVDNNNHVWDCIVTEVSYDFNQENIIVSVTAIDIFSYQMSRRNIGYTIQNDDTNFIGALSLDEWAQKIKKECKINWTYNPVDTQNEQLMQILAERDGVTTGEESFNDVKSFDLSDSNAYDALTKLASAFGMQLKLNYEQQSFGFIPDKNLLDKGFYLNPKVSLKELSISTDGKSQTTVLNVCGPTDSLSHEITLIGTIPASVLNWFGTQNWEKTKYYSFSAGETLNDSVLAPVGLSAAEFGATGDFTLNNDCNLYGDYLMRNLNSSYILGSISYVECGTLNDDEHQFLSSISVVPYLENRLIDISYFKKTNLLSDVDYDNWCDLLYNKIRIANGRLMYFTNKRLQAQKNTTEYATNLSVVAQDLNAYFEGDLENFLNSSAQVFSVGTQFSTLYEQLKSFTNNLNLYNVEQLVTYYQAQWDNAQQIFYSNLYNFEQYWNASASLDIDYNCLNKTTKLLQKDSQSKYQFSTYIFANGQTNINYNQFYQAWLLETVFNSNTSDPVISWIPLSTESAKTLNSPNIWFNQIALKYAIKNFSGDTSKIKIYLGSKEEATGGATLNVYSVETAVNLDYNNLSDLTINIPTTSACSTMYLGLQYLGSYSSSRSPVLFLNDVRLLGRYSSYDLNNGQFYIETMNSDDVILVEKDANIRNNLDRYWTAAKNAGKLSDYYLPSIWSELLLLQKGTSSFSSDCNIFKIKYCPLYKNINGKIDLNYKFLPKIASLNDGNADIQLSPNRPNNITPTHLQKMTWTFSAKKSFDGTSAWNNLYDALVTEEANVVGDAVVITVPQPAGISFSASDYTSFIDYKKGTILDYIPQWWFQPLTGFYKVYYIPVDPNTDTTKNLNPIKIEDKNIGCSYIRLYGQDEANDVFGGIYKESFQSAYSIIKNQIKKNKEEDSAYELALDAQRKLWTEMYTNYDNLIVENNYTNDSALTPALLIKAAQTKFKELSSPEPNYNVSMLDVFCRDSSYKESPQITDQVHLNTQETNFIIEYKAGKDLSTSNKDKLVELLNKTLFVSEISYSLRSNINVSITVNPVRYGDVLIDRLAKLL